MGNDLFARARDLVTIGAVAAQRGIKLQRAGDRLRGVCPIYDCGKKSKSQPFSVDLKQRHFKCWSCSEAGDVVELERQINGGTPLEAALRLVGESPAAAPSRTAVRAPVLEPEDEPSGSTLFASRMIAESVPAKNTPVQRYLLARGVSGQILINALQRLRYHGAVWREGRGRSAVASHAMLAIPVAPDGAGGRVHTGGVHVTYLAANGLKHIGKKMFGPQSINGRVGGVWLGPINGDGPLVEGEGNESTLSLAMLQDGPCRPLAALALDRMQGGWLADRQGCRDIKVPAPDPRRPGLTWPEPPGAPWGKVIIGVDHDMSPQQIKVRGAFRRSTAMATMTPSDRARVCGALADASWARTTTAPRVVMAPPLGHDWNTYLLETLSG